jgi:hypothetical protein
LGQQENIAQYPDLHLNQVRSKSCGSHSPESDCRIMTLDKIVAPMHCSKLQYF